MAYRLFFGAQKALTTKDTKEHEGDPTRLMPFVALQVRLQKAIGQFLNSFLAMR